MKSTVIQPDESIVEGFAKFARRKIGPVVTNELNAVIYTRVSTKEQAEHNLSLETQLKACNIFAEKGNYRVMNRFGGTYESAKTDERKEFGRMLDFVRKSREKIGYIIVFSVDRFSRSGANAIFIASELKKEGIKVLSVTQPTDTSTSGGSLQQNIQFIFSQYDNDMRKEKCLAGMKEKLLKGSWIATIPLGYDQIIINRDRRLEINKEGRILAKAFQWKASGVSSADILRRLAALNLPMRKQKLSNILRNPFYCGLIRHKLIDGKIIEGQHEAIVSKEVFLQANGMLAKNHQKYHHADNGLIMPLKIFVKCDDCGSSFTGYEVKAKGKSYYKCNRKGCKSHKSTEQMHEGFKELLTRFSFDERLKGLLATEIESTFEETGRQNRENEKIFLGQMQELDKKIETIQERYALGEIGKDLYDKFMGRFREERDNISIQLEGISRKTSNLSDSIRQALEMSCKLGSLWSEGDATLKSRLQYLVFPEGIRYDDKNGAYRTGKVNSVFELISSITEDMKETKTGEKYQKSQWSRCSVARGPCGTAISSLNAAIFIKIFRIELTDS